VLSTHYGLYISVKYKIGGCPILYFWTCRILSVLLAFSSLFSAHSLTRT